MKDDTQPFQQASSAIQPPRRRFLKAIPFGVITTAAACSRGPTSEQIQRLTTARTAVQQAADAEMRGQARPVNGTDAIFVTLTKTGSTFTQVVEVYPPDHNPAGVDHGNNDKPNSLMHYRRGQIFNQVLLELMPTLSVFRGRLKGPDPKNHPDHESLIITPNDRIIFRCTDPFQLTIDRNDDMFDAVGDNHNPFDSRDDSTPFSPMNSSATPPAVVPPITGGSYPHYVELPLVPPFKQGNNNTNKFNQKFYKFKIVEIDQDGNSGVPNNGATLDPDIICGLP